MSGLMLGLGISAAAVIVLVLAGCVLFRVSAQSALGLARLLPDTVRLAAALYRRSGAPRSVRWRLRIALVYNLQPINLIPDFIPVIGVADNILILAWALRGAMRVSGDDAVVEHWTGTVAGLHALRAALRLTPAAG